MRPQADHEKAHPEGAVNVPLFQRVNFKKPSFGGLLRAAALMANGVTPVEQNPDFVAQLAVAGGKPRPRVILACEAGGVLDPSTSFPFGKESRSLKVPLAGTLSYICTARECILICKRLHMVDGA